MKNSNNFINRLVNEAVGEAIRRLGGGNANPAQDANVQPTNKLNFIPTPPKRDKYENTKKVNISKAYYEEIKGYTFLVLVLSQIHAQHGEILCNKWNKKYGGRLFNSVEKKDKKFNDNGTSPIYLYVRGEKEDEFINIVPNLCQDIADLNTKKNGFYDNQYLEGLIDSFIGRISSCPSKEDLELYEERTKENLDSIIQKLSDPNFIKQIGLIGGSTSLGSAYEILKNSQSYGWRISPINQMEVGIQLGANATFVTNQWTWKHLFNREVNDVSKFALITKADNSKPTDLNAWNRAARILGYETYDNYKKTMSKLSKQQIFSISCLANMLNPATTIFYKEAVYDVSNTTLINGMDDVWNEEVGFKNNLLGLPNDVANARVKELSDNYGIDYQPAEAKPMNSDNLINVLVVLQKICEKYCGKKPDLQGTTIGDKIAHCVDFYFKNYYCVNANIVQGASKEAIGSIMALAVCGYYGAFVESKANVLNNVLNTFKRDPRYQDFLATGKKEYEELIKEINKDMLLLSKKQMKSKASKQNAENIESILNLNGGNTGVSPQMTKAPDYVMKNINDTQKSREERDKEWDMANNERNNQMVSEGLEVIKPHKLLSNEEFLSLFDGNNVNELSEEIADEETIENIQESFYSFLDKLEKF